VKRRNFLLPVYAADGWFNHEELPGACIPLELDTSHAGKRHLREESCG
jgi:hypothetical protein